jgi:hypothetical protein
VAPWEGPAEPDLREVAGRNACVHGSDPQLSESERLICLEFLKSLLVKLGDWTGSLESSHRVLVHFHVFAFPTAAYLPCYEPLDGGCSYGQGTVVRIS